MSSFIVVCLWFFYEPKDWEAALTTQPAHWQHHRYLTQESWWKTSSFFIFTEQFKESCKIPFKGWFSPVLCLSLSPFCCLIELMFEVVIITVLKKPILKTVASFWNNFSLGVKSMHIHWIAVVSAKQPSWGERNRKTPIFNLYVTLSAFWFGPAVDSARWPLSLELPVQVLSQPTTPATLHCVNVNIFYLCWNGELWIK